MLGCHYIQAGLLERLFPIKDISSMHTFIIRYCTCNGDMYESPQRNWLKIWSYLTPYFSLYNSVILDYLIHIEATCHVYICKHQTCTMYTMEAVWCSQTSSCTSMTSGSNID